MMREGKIIVIEQKIAEQTESEESIFEPYEEVTVIEKIYKSFIDKFIELYNKHKPINNTPKKKKKKKKAEADAVQAEEQKKKIPEIYYLKTKICLFLNWKIWKD